MGALTRPPAEAARRPRGLIAEVPTMRRLPAPSKPTVSRLFASLPAGPVAGLLASLVAGLFAGPDSLTSNLA